MGVLSALWPFTKAEAPDYEIILSRLANEVAEAKINLSEIKLRERRSLLLLNLYSVGLWGLWAALWWLNALPWSLVGLSSSETAVRALGPGLTLVGPLLLVLSNRVVRWYYKSQRGKEEVHLRALLTKQHSYIEDIKKKSNFYKTKEMLDKYAEEPSSSPTRGTPVRRQNAGIPQAPSTPVRAGAPGPTSNPSARNAPVTPQRAMVALGTPQLMRLSPALGTSPMQPFLPVPQKRWYDHLADKLMGDDPSQAAQSQYALVCGGCFQHNGLVASRAQWEKTQWICPRCSYRNPAPATMGSAGNLPSSPVTKPAADSKPSTPAKQAVTEPTPDRRQLRSSKSASRLGQEVVSAADVSVDDEDMMDVDSLED